jgi:hypothetical protein
LQESLERAGFINGLTLRDQGIVATIWGAADRTATVALLIAALPCLNPCKQTKNKLDMRYLLSLIPYLAN